MTTTLLRAKSKNFAEADFTVKIVMVGESGVGKSSLLKRFSNNEFVASHFTTIGVDFEMRTIELEGKRAKLHIWDTAGQERFHNIVTCYYRGADSILLVFDVTLLSSFENIRFWLDEAKKYAVDDAQFVLVANKTDMVRERVVSLQQIQALASSLDMPFVETSAKDASNVDRCFSMIADKTIKARLHRLNERRSFSSLPTLSLLPRKNRKLACCTIL